jgi:hypothetical protein
MKKKKITIIFLIIIIFLAGYFLVKSVNRNNTGNYLGSYYKGNYVWGGAMNLAWKNLSESMLDGEKIRLSTKEKAALDMAEKLNNAVFEKSDIDEESYYIKIGYGQEVVDLINQECREKFPEKTFPDLDLFLFPKEIISYAYLLKDVEYLAEFKEKDVKFEDIDVKGFHARSSEEKDNIRIIKYWNNNKFIISLRLKDEEDELFLAKGFDMTSPQDIADEINEYNSQDDVVLIGSEDIFEMPKIELDYQRTYGELADKLIANENLEDYFIGKMIEKIKFDMDHKGAKVEQEAIIIISESIGVGGKIEIPKHKEFILDKPFWIVMKRANSNNPYFILGVNNENVMERVN